MVGSSIASFALVVHMMGATHITETLKLFLEQTGTQREVEPGFSSINSPGCPLYHNLGQNHRSLEPKSARSESEITPPDTSSSPG